MFDGMADCSEVDVLYAEIKSFDPVNKNGNRLIPGLACSADPIN
jgi:hypothetical protein